MVLFCSMKQHEFLFFTIDRQYASQCLEITCLTQVTFSREPLGGKTNYFCFNEVTIIIIVGHTQGVTKFTTHGITTYYKVYLIKLDTIAFLVGVPISDFCRWSTRRGNSMCFPLVFASSGSAFGPDKMSLSPACSIN